MAISEAAISELPICSHLGGIQREADTTDGLLLGNSVAGPHLVRNLQVDFATTRTLHYSMDVVSKPTSTTVLGVVTGSSVKPSAAQVQARQDHTGTLVLSWIDRALSAGDITIDGYTTVGLVPGDTYWLHVTTLSSSMSEPWSTVSTAGPLATLTDLGTAFNGIVLGSSSTLESLTVNTTDGLLRGDGTGLAVMVTTADQCRLRDTTAATYVMFTAAAVALGEPEVPIDVVGLVTDGIVHGVALLASPEGHHSDGIRLDDQNELVQIGKSTDGLSMGETPALVDTAVETSDRISFSEEILGFVGSVSVLDGLLLGSAHSATPIGGSGVSDGIQFGDTTVSHPGGIVLDGLALGGNQGPIDISTAVSDGLLTGEILGPIDISTAAVDGLVLGSVEAATSYLSVSDGIRLGSSILGSPTVTTETDTVVLANIAVGADLGSNVDGLVLGDSPKSGPTAIGTNTLVLGDATDATYVKFASDKLAIGESQRVGASTLTVDMLQIADEALTAFTKPPFRQEQANTHAAGGRAFSAFSAFGTKGATYTSGSRQHTSFHREQVRKEHVPGNRMFAVAFPKGCKSVVSLGSPRISAGCIAGSRVRVVTIPSSTLHASSIAEARQKVYHAAGGRACAIANSEN